MPHLQDCATSHDLVYHNINMCETVAYLLVLTITYASIKVFCYLPQEGWTSLHFAASEGHLEVCKLLCQYGADLSVTTEVSIFLLNLLSVTIYTDNIID